MTPSGAKSAKSAYNAESSTWDFKHESDGESDVSSDSEEEKERRKFASALTDVYWTASIREANSHSWRLYLLLALTGVFMGLLSFVNTAGIAEVGSLRLKLLWSVVGDGGWVRQLFGVLIWIAFEISLTGLGHIVSRQEPMSFGSGIPEVRCELQGTHLKHYYSKKVFLAKVSGLILAETAGLPVGKEGPFVHMSSIVSLGLLRTRFFEKARLIPEHLRIVLLASAASATCSTFGVPIGSVLFALEVMPDITWANTSYWACLLAAVIGSLVLKILQSSWKDTVVNLLPLTSGDYVELGTSAWFARLIQCIALGVICGRLGAIFVHVHIKLQRRVQAWLGAASVSTQTPKIFKMLTDVRHAAKHEPMLPGAVTLRQARTGVTARSREADVSKKLSSTWKRRALFLCVSVAAVDALITLGQPLFRGVTQYKLLWILASTRDIDWSDCTTQGNLGPNLNIPRFDIDTYWKNVSPLFGFAFSLIAKLLLTIFTLVLPMPSGCIVPLYVVGALLGRTFGAAMNELTPDWTWPSHHTDLAIVGATTLTASICRSFSVVVVVIELVGLHDRILPLSLAAIAGIYVANLYSPSIFEALMAEKRLPAAPQARKLLDGVEPVSSMMNSCVPMLSACGGTGSAGRAVLLNSLKKHPDAAHFVILTGEQGTAHSEQDNTPIASVLGVTPRRTVEHVAEAAAAKNAQVRFMDEMLVMAPQVPSWMPVKHAMHILEFYNSSLVLVSDSAQLLGVVSFRDFVNKRHAAVTTMV